MCRPNCGRPDAPILILLLTAWHREQGGSELPVWVSAFTLLKESPVSETGMVTAEMDWHLEGEGAGEGRRAGPICALLLCLPGDPLRNANGLRKGGWHGPLPPLLVLRCSARALQAGPHAPIWFQRAARSGCRLLEIRAADKQG